MAKHLVELNSRRYQHGGAEKSKEPQWSDEGSPLSEQKPEGHEYRDVKENVSEVVYGA